MAKLKKRSWSESVAILKKEVIRLNKRFALWVMVGTFVFVLAFAGCQKKEEPAPAATPAPAALGVPGAVSPTPAGGETGPGTPAATAETKPAEKKEEGAKKY